MHQKKHPTDGWKCLLSLYWTWKKPDWYFGFPIMKCCWTVLVVSREALSCVAQEAPREQDCFHTLPLTSALTLWENLCERDGSVSKAHFVMRPRCFHSIWVACLQLCSLIHTVLPTSSATGSQERVFHNLKKILKNTLEVKNDTCHLQGFHERTATKLETGSTEIVESVQCLTKFNFIFKWSSPWHPRIESAVIYHGCHNRIWGHFLPLWPPDWNSFVLGKIMVLKCQSCSQMTSSQEAQFLTSAQGAAPNVEKG